MHHYRRNIGDYHKKAGRLSILQHGVYNLLIDACYDRERFPTREEAIDWVWASTPEEEQAVDFILRKFFVLRDGVFVQTRIEEEIAEYQEHCAKQAENGKKGGRPKKPKTSNKKPTGFSNKPNGNPTESGGVENKSLTTNQLTTNQLTTNQEKPKNTLSETASVSDRFETFWEFARGEYKKLDHPTGSKSEALVAFKKLSPDDQLCKRMCEALRAQVTAKLDRARLGHDSAQLKHLCRWISKSCYDDDPDPIPSSSVVPTTRGSPEQRTLHTFGKVDYSKGAKPNDGF